MKSRCQAAKKHHKFTQYDLTLLKSYDMLVRRRPKLNFYCIFIFFGHSISFK